MMKRLLAFTSSLILAAAAIASAAPAPTIELVPNGTSFSVMANNFSKVSGFEMTIQYNPLALQNPQVSQGGLIIGGIFMANVSASSSTVRIVLGNASKTIDGSGKLATIGFSPIPAGAAKGNVNILPDYKFTVIDGNVRKTLRVNLLSSAEQNLGKLENDAIVTCLNDSQNCTATVTASGSVNIVHDGKSTNQSNDPGTGGGSSGSNPSSGSSNVTNNPVATALSQVSNYATQTGQTASVGSITLPQDQMAATAADKKPDSQPLVTDLRKDMTLPVGGAETAAAATSQKPVEQIKEAESKFVSHKSVLQYFAGYKGDRNPKSLIALFAERVIPHFTQEPFIALSDGKSTVKLRLLVMSSGRELPKFIMQGASLKKLPVLGEDGFWSMEALPKKDIYEAKLTVIDGDRMLEFPLTVVPAIAPVLGKDKKFSEADFTRFLAKPAKFDLNNDKKFDYIDDFIYTANYITALKIKPEKLKTEEPKAAAEEKKKGQPKSKGNKTKDDVEKPVQKPADAAKKPAEAAGQK